MLASRLVTTGRSAQDLCMSATLVTGSVIPGLLVSNCRTSQPNQHITNLSAGATTGSGRCFFRTESGDFIDRTDTRQYAAARLISPPGTTSPPGTVLRLVRATNPQNKMSILTCTQCPYYNNQILDTPGTDGRKFSVQCGRDSSASITKKVAAANMNSCMTKCDADPTCNGFSWQLDVGQVGKGIPKDDEPSIEYGTCHFRSATDAKGDLAPYYDSGRDFAARLPSGVTTAPAPSAAAPAPTFTAPATNWSPEVTCSQGGLNAGGQYTDRFGALWEVRCQTGLDVLSSEDVGTAGQGIFSCWKGCNNRPGCSSFVYNGTVDGSMCRDYHYFAAINANVLLSESAHWNRQM
jgi:hypothetical protein